MPVDYQLNNVILFGIVVRTIHQTLNALLGTISLEKFLRFYQPVLNIMPIPDKASLTSLPFPGNVVVIKTGIPCQQCRSAAQIK